jgi:hypothetical protein
MTKATIRATAHNYVTLEYDDNFGERRSRSFHVGHNGGYVREDDRQICDGLAYRGWTLRVNDPKELLPLIRRQWRQVRRANAEYWL